MIGSVMTTGISGVAAHIQVAAMGKNGPVIVPLTRGSGGEWLVPPGTRLSSEQMKGFKSGDMNVNVHGEANKGGEIRAQLAP